MFHSIFYLIYLLCRINRAEFEKELLHEKQQMDVFRFKEIHDALTLDDLKERAITVEDLFLQIEASIYVLRRARRTKDSNHGRTIRSNAVPEF